MYKDKDGDLEVEHLSNLSEDEAKELGTVVGALIGLGIEGEEEMKAGALAGGEAAAEGVLHPIRAMRRRGMCSRTSPTTPPRR